MVTKKGDSCFLCYHPVVKRLIEFYCLIWGVIGLLFLVGLVWGFVKFKTLGPDSLFRGFRRLKWEDRVIGPEKGAKLRPRLKSLSAEQSECLLDILGEERLEQLRQTPGLATPEEREDIQICFQL